MYFVDQKTKENKNDGIYEINRRYRIERDRSSLSIFKSDRVPKYSSNAITGKRANSWIKK